MKSRMIVELKISREEVPGNSYLISFRVVHASKVEDPETSKTYSKDNEEFLFHLVPLSTLLASASVEAAVRWKC